MQKRDALSDRVLAFYMAKISRRGVVDAFTRIAFCAELCPERALEHKLDAKSLSQLAWSIRSLEGEFSERVDDGTLRHLPGMNDTLYSIVEHTLDHTRSSLQSEVEGWIPKGLFDVRKVPGLGPKKVRQLWKELEIASLAELQYACNENRLLDLKGFGKKTQDKVALHLDELQKTQGHLRIDQMQKRVAPLIDFFKSQDDTLLFEASGALARAAETLSGVRFIYCNQDPQLTAARVTELLEDFECEAEFEPSDYTSVVTHYGESEVDIVCVDQLEQLSAQKIWHSADDNYRERLAAHAATLNFTFDALGFFHEGDVCEDEKSVYEKLGLHFVPAERRREGVPLVHHRESHTRLVERGDLRGALHNHTKASDGVNTLEQMRDAAAAMSFEYLGISEHSESAVYAGGLEGERLLKQVQTIESLNSQRHSCTLLHGVESDIKKFGALDYDSSMLEGLHVVIASIHARHTTEFDALTDCMCAVAENPNVDVIGHPTGRLLLGRPPSLYDMERFFETCKKHNTIVELNANPARLDLSTTNLEMAKSFGVKVSIAADAHSCEGLHDIDYGVALARRAGLTRNDIINTLGKDELLAHFSSPGV